MMIAFVALLSVTLLLPVTAAAGTFLLLRGVLDIWAAAPAALLALSIMAFEAALIVEWLGGVFERTDAATAGISV
jgi:hypothetical protein